MPRKPKGTPIRAAEGIDVTLREGDPKIFNATWTVTLTVPQMAAAQHAVDMIVGTMVSMLPKRYVERSPGSIRLHNAESGSPAVKAQMALLALMLSTMEALVDASEPLQLEPLPGGVAVTNNPGPVIDKGQVN